MTDLNELNTELALAHETGTHWAELAEQRQKSIHELAQLVNALNFEGQTLRASLSKLNAAVDEMAADRTRLTYLIDTQAIVESAYRPGKPAIFWLVFPNGEVQPDVFPTAAEAIDAAMDQEASHV